MSFLGVPDFPARGIDDYRKTLQDREEKLANARKQHDVILADIRNASDRVDMGNQTARIELVGLNKSKVAAGRLILSIEAEVAESKKRVDMAQAQADAMALKQAQSDAAVVPGDRLFEVVCPDGVRRVRHRAASIEALQKVLQPQYHVVSEIFGASEDDTGGFAASIGSGAKSNMMDGLLQAHGDTLLAFLEKHGITGNPVKISLPPNGREM
jgi:hypothetical protein